MAAPLSHQPALLPISFQSDSVALTVVASKAFSTNAMHRTVWRTLDDPATRERYENFSRERMHKELADPAFLGRVHGAKCVVHDAKGSERIVAYVMFMAPKETGPLAPSSRQSEGIDASPAVVDENRPSLLPEGCDRDLPALAYKMINAAVDTALGIGTTRDLRWWYVHELAVDPDF